MWKPESKKSVIFVTAKVAHNKDKSKWRLEVLEKRNKDNVLIEPGYTLVLLASDCPKNMQSGLLSLRLSGDKRQVYGFYPAMGVYKAKFKGFVAKEGEKPAPKLVQDTFGNEDYKFSAILEIVEGQFSGVEVPFFGWYYIGKGAPIADKNEHAFLYTKSFGKSPRVQLLDAFLSAIGVFEGDDPIPYRDNLLPLFQKLALKQANIFNIVLENGYINSFSAIVEDNLPPWDGEEEPKEPTVNEKEEEKDFDRNDNENWT